MSGAGPAFSTKVQDFWLSIVIACRKVTRFRPVMAMMNPENELKKKHTYANSHTEAICCHAGCRTEGLLCLPGD
jgi:hypothetical protein